MEDKDQEYNKEREDWKSEEKEDQNSDDFGLPNVSYNPIEREESGYSGDTYEREPEEKIEERYYNYEEKKGSQALAVIAFFVVFLGVLFALYWFVLRDEPAPEPIEQIPQEAFEPEPQPDPAAEAPPMEEEPEDTEPAPPPEPAAGSHTNVAGAQGSYYVVVGSFIDDDLAMDYGSELNAAGLNTYLIEPYGDNKYYRLAVGSFDTWGQALNRLEELEGQYGEELWILKY